MTAEQLILRLLLESPDITGIVGARIYIGEFPQGFEVPCILLKTVWEEPEYHVPGFAHAFMARTEAQSIAAGSAAAIELSNAVRDALIDVANIDVFDGASPANKLGSITVWKLGTAIHDVGQDRIYHRRISEFKSRWLQP